MEIKSEEMVKGDEDIKSEATWSEMEQRVNSSDLRGHSC